VPAAVEARGTRLAEDHLLSLALLRDRSIEFA
jgi:hypothetical protein